MALAPDLQHSPTTSDEALQMLCHALMLGSPPMLTLTRC